MQVRKELSDFQTSKIRLARFGPEEANTVRYLNKESDGYYFNQAQTLAIIDLYWNSQFENGPTDKLKQRKIFMNKGKFRSQVSSKQIDLDTKNFIFLPDDYADPFTALFMQKDFKEWAKDSSFGELVNLCVENFPKYGTLLLKKVGKDIRFVPLQVMSNEQSAESLATSSYVIETHSDMPIWEMKDMPNWDCENLNMKLGDTANVYERYGRVPVKWLKEHDGSGKAVEDGDEGKTVDAMVIMCWPKGLPDFRKSKDGVHIFYAGKVAERPYREVHWDKQHGRWLGIGVMEDLIENQRAQNIVVNLIRRSLHWSSKRIMQTSNADVAAKNLAKDVEDGEILEVGTNGQITEVNLSAKTNADFTTFLNEFEKNSDQKAFTYEVATGESMPSGTPFRLGVVLSNAVASYFGFKKQKLGLFMKKAINDFLIPQFIKDMSDRDRVIAMFSGEAGFETLRDAAMQYVKTEAAKAAMFGGKVADESVVEQAAKPLQGAQTLFFRLKKETYKTAKYKYDFTATGEEIDLATKLESLKSLFQVLSQRQDPRAEKVLERISALSGESMSQFGAPTPPAAAFPNINSATNAKQPAPAAA